jgi:predicted signal transduction protein with EAL and GGDEF domain
LRLLGCVGEQDTVSRLGGDEFVLLMPRLQLTPDDSPQQHAERLAQRVIAALGRPYPLGGTSHTSTPSIGIALFAGEGMGVDEIIKRADVAMYQAKAAGRNTLRFFDPVIQAEVAQRLQLAEDLRDAVAHGQLSLLYQPQHDDTGRLVGAEALLRWTHPVRGPVSPAVFIPLAEQVGLIEGIGQWVMHTACEQLQQWLEHPALQGWQTGFSLAVNVSAHQFRSRTFVDDVQRVLRQTGLAPGQLKLELTESLMVHDVEDIIGKMKAIRPLGVRFSLDDFGTGYSSLSYLKRLPLDQLKIDQSFVRDLLTDPNDAGIARTVVALGQTLGLDVIAEGVETDAQRQCLAEMGCRVYQGYFFSRPLKNADFLVYALACIQ